MLERMQAEQLEETLREFHAQPNLSKYCLWHLSQFLPELVVNEKFLSIVRNVSLAKSITNFEAPGPYH